MWSPVAFMFAQIEKSDLILFELSNFSLHLSVVDCRAGYIFDKWTVPKAFPFDYNHFTAKKMKIWEKWKLGGKFVVHKTFLEVYNKKVFQDSLKQMK